MDKVFDVGVIVGRFQTDELTPAHLELIDTVYNTHSNLVIILGLSPQECTPKNPLDYRIRKIFLQEQYPKADVLYVNDMRYDDDWSRQLDRIVRSVTRKHQTVCLYGGRDSFLPHYNGQHPAKELTLKESEFISATSRRKIIRNSVTNHQEFRKGIIYGTASIGARSIPAPIVVISDQDHKHILMGKRYQDRKYSFITDELPCNKTFEVFSSEIVYEKTGFKIEPDDLKCYGSVIVPDWKYRSEDDTVIGMIYVTTVNFGKATAKGDMTKLKWIDIETIHDHVSSEHYTIADFLYHHDF